MTQWLVGTLITTSGLMLLVLIVRESTRRTFGARAAYGLWVIPAARVLMPTLTQTVDRATSPRPMLLTATAAPSPSLFMKLGGWPTALILLWAAGALGLFLTRLIQFRQARSAILAAAIEIGRAGNIRVVKSAEVTGPVAFGVFHRVIAVPIDFEIRFSEHERSLALDHEIAHHCSGDIIANSVAFALLCLQWFNPLAWVAHSAFRFDQEAACDARVLERTDRSRRADYGRAIAKAASGKALLFAGALDQPSLLEKRLKCMLSASSANRRLIGRLTVTAAVAAALPLTATRAIHYVDIPTADGFHRLAPSAPPATRTSEDQPMILARAEPESVASEKRRVRANQGQPRRDADQAQRNWDESARNAEQAQQDRDEDLRNAEQVQKDRDEDRRNIEQVQRDRDEDARNAEQVQRDQD